MFMLPPVQLPITLILSKDSVARLSTSELSGPDSARCWV